MTRPPPGASTVVRVHIIMNASVHLHLGVGFSSTQGGLQHPFPGLRSSLTGPSLEERQAAAAHSTSLRQRRFKTSEPRRLYTGRPPLRQEKIRARNQARLRYDSRWVRVHSPHSRVFFFFFFSQRNRPLPPLPPGPLRPHPADSVCPVCVFVWFFECIPCALWEWCLRWK